MKRFNISYKSSYQTKSGEVKSSWRRIGTAFEGDKGISIIIDSVPVGWDGRASLFPADEERKGQDVRPGGGEKTHDSFFDSEVPF